MDVDRQKEIASKGGRTAHSKGTAHQWSREEARVAGRKGGMAVSQDREHMAEIGRTGGEMRGLPPGERAKRRLERSSDYKMLSPGRGPHKAD
jgi:hypothetical protein